MEAIKLNLDYMTASNNRQAAIAQLENIHQATEAIDARFGNRLFSLSGIGRKIIAFRRRL
jgi:hypothetical protein